MCSYSATGSLGAGSAACCTLSFSGFIPGVNWLNREIARTREEVCDNFVLKQGDSVGYAQMLLELSERCGERGFALSLLGLFSRRWTLEERIRGILDPVRVKVTRTGRTSLAIMTILLGTMCLIVGGVGAFWTNF